MVVEFLAAVVHDDDNDHDDGVVVVSSSSSLLLFLFFIFCLFFIVDIVIITTTTTTIIIIIIITFIIIVICFFISSFCSSHTCILHLHVHRKTMRQYLKDQGYSTHAVGNGTWPFASCPPHSSQRVRYCESSPYLVALVDGGGVSCCC